MNVIIDPVHKLPNSSSKKPPRSALAKRMRLTIIILICVFGSIFAFDMIRGIFLNRFFAHFALPAPTISSTKAITKTWVPAIEAVGSLVAINGVEVSPEVAGMVTAIHFDSGQMVQQGQPLVQLDDRTDQQDLKNLMAQLTLSQLSYNRQINLIKTNATSQSSLDQANAELQEGEASVAKTKILISQKLIAAPFSGKIGIRQVNIGQYVSPGTPLVNLQSLDPLYIQFNLPQQHLKALYVNQPVEITIDAGTQPFKGKITGIDASIDTQTRNILVQATVPNAKMQLYPGMFANVRVLLPTQEKVVTVPQTAVSVSLYGDSVFVLTPNGKDKEGLATFTVHRRYVTTGERKGNEIAVVQGLKAGEDVVSTGQLKLEDGIQVHINNSVQLPNLEPENLKQNRT